MKEKHFIWTHANIKIRQLIFIFEIYNSIETLESASHYALAMRHLSDYLKIPIKEIL